MKTSIDWRQVWEDQSIRDTVPDFELDRGIRPREHDIEALSAAELLDFIGPQSSETVLDAGCGTGVNMLRLHSHVRRIIGMDYSKGCVARSRKRLSASHVENAGVLLGSITDIPLPDDSVDKVLCMSVVQYLDDVEVRRALSEFLRVVRDGGLIILHVKNRSSLYFSTLWLAKHIKRLLGRSTRFEYVRPYRWYLNELTSLDCEILAYNSFNVLMVEAMPRRLLDLLQRLELKYRNTWLLQRPEVRRHGAELKIKVRVVKRVKLLRSQSQPRTN